METKIPSGLNQPCYERFLRCQQFIFEWEGLWVCDPADKGGETWRGLCRKHYPDLSVWRSRDALTTDEKKTYIGLEDEIREAYACYYVDYFLPTAYKINDERLGFLVYNMAVNAGVSRAIKLLQRAAGVPTDGIFGRRTSDAVNCQKTGLLATYHAECYSYYYRIGVGKKAKFLQGWLNRLKAAMKFVREEAHTLDGPHEGGEQ